MFCKSLNEFTTLRINWLTIFNRTLIADPPIGSYAPLLSEKLAHLFISRPLSNEVMASLCQTLTILDNKTKYESIVGLIIKYLGMYSDSLNIYSSEWWARLSNISGMVGRVVLQVLHRIQLIVSRFS